MNPKEIIITETDLTRIKASLEHMDAGERREQKHLAELEAELNRATVVAAGEVPDDVITMNSSVRLLDLDSKKKLKYSVVYPPEADAAEGRISVLAPIGTALLGYRVGDEIEWTVPSGVRRFRVEKILFQPEAEGKFEL
ncbi:MAG: nucleoside diphosphate kinase regulator [Candidatus Hydrogenedentes bacterium]|nr:nucleoside diphosphate kinase regulator [Candidatus Hydrogenedentota bacterium]